MERSQDHYPKTNGLDFEGEDRVSPHLLSVTRTVVSCSKRMRGSMVSAPKAMEAV